jgi:hypothetical protein
LGIPSTRKKGIDIIILKKWPKTNLTLEDNGYETHVFVYNKKHDMLVLDMKGNKEMEKEIILKSFYGPSKKSKDKELNASNDIKECFDNFDIKMLSILQGGSPEYI